MVPDYGTTWTVTLNEIIGFLLSFPLTNAEEAIVVSFKLFDRSLVLIGCPLKPEDHVPSFNEDDSRIFLESFQGAWITFVNLEQEDRIYVGNQEKEFEEFDDARDQV